MEQIWVVAEQRDGVPANIALELLTAARRFASVVEAVTWGPGSARACRDPRPVRSDQGL